MQTELTTLEPTLNFEGKIWKIFKPELEDQFIAGIVSNNELLAEFDFITPQHFYQPNAKTVWTKVKQAQEKGLKVDLLMLSEYFGTLGDLGGENKVIMYIFDITQKMSFASNLKAYAEELHNLFIRRSLINLSVGLQQQAENPNSEINDVCELMFGRMQELINSRGDSSFRHINKVGMATLKNTEDKQYGLLPPSIPSEYAQLDNTTGGFEGGQLITIGARPSIGKSTFALNLAMNMAKSNHPTLFISLETTPERMMEKIISRETGILQSSLATGKGLDSSHWEKLYQSVTNTEKIPFYFDDQAIHSALDVEARIDKLERESKTKIEVVFIDYLQLMLREDGGNNNNNAIGKITMALKLLAMKKKITIVILSQLSRGVESRSDKRPIMSDLRDSGSIEQDSNMIMLLYRDDYYNQGTSTPNTMEVNICKNRDGSTGQTTLHFNRTISKLSTIHN